MRPTLTHHGVVHPTPLDMVYLSHQHHQYALAAAASAATHHAQGQHMHQPQPSYYGPPGAIAPSYASPPQPQLPIARPGVPYRPSRRSSHNLSNQNQHTPNSLSNTNTRTASPARLCSSNSVASSTRGALDDEPSSSRLHEGTSGSTTIGTGGDELERLREHLAALRTQVRRAAVENERKGKELEIARWRLECVEVERKAEDQQVCVSL